MGSEPVGVPGSEDGIHLLLLEGPRRAMRSRRPVLEPRLALGSWIPTPSLGRLSFVNNLFGNHS
jgi:hypothetical protein